jgi:hypothetical protein
MSEEEIYISLAIRFLNGGTRARKDAHELYGFACYHAFKSAGGALVTHYGGRYPRGHHGKLNAFIGRCRPNSFRLAVSALAIKLQALRNLFLYPNQIGPAWTHPMDLVSSEQIEQLHKRVRGVVTRIQTEIT